VVSLPWAFPELADDTGRRLSMAGLHGRRRILVPRPAIQYSADSFRVDATDLLEKQGDITGYTPVPNVTHPVQIERPEPRPRLTADDNPVDPGQAKLGSGPSNGSPGRNRTAAGTSLNTSARQQ
jgi:hypothetical protein